MRTENVADEFQDENIDNELIQTILDEFSDGSSPNQSSTLKDKEYAPADFKSKKDVLEQMLKVAIKKEEYEEAARLRDEINKVIEVPMYSYKSRQTEKQDSADKKVD